MTIPTPSQEALSRLTRWRDGGADAGILVSADSARHQFAADVLTLLSLAEALQKPADPVRYGCHCDLESMDDGFEPDGCVIDEGRPDDCIYSKCGDKLNCKYWRPITPKREATP